jgi:hypothetical protein
MKKFFVITMMMFSISAVSFANTPCCNSKMNHCTKCSKSCTKASCTDYCTKECKATGGCKACK